MPLVDKIVRNLQSAFHLARSTSAWGRVSGPEATRACKPLSAHLLKVSLLRQGPYKTLTLDVQDELNTFRPFRLHRILASARTMQGAATTKTRALLTSTRRAFVKAPAISRDPNSV